MLRKYLVICLLSIVTSCAGGVFEDYADPGTQEDLQANTQDRVYFETNSAKLTSASKFTLDRQVEWLNEFEGVQVAIQGHCDERGTREYNLALGAKRANAVKDYLGAAGVDSSRISTVSYGKDKPVVLGTGLSVWAKNRVAVTVVLD